MSKNQAKSKGAKGEVVPVEVVTPEVMPNDAQIAAQIAEDIRNAELGAFCRVRAGVGLCNFRDMNAHGMWEARMIEMFPGKSRSTLFRYMQQGRKFCEQVSLDAGRVYDKMMRVDVKALQAQAALPADQRKALPVRGVAKSEAEGNRVMNALVLMAAGERPEAEKPKAKPLTASEKAAAWRDYTASLGEKLRDWGDNPLTWKALETDDLEKFRAELVLVVGLVKDELRSREENAVK
jgi:hypothetical protein